MGTEAVGARTEVELPVVSSDSGATTWWIATSLLIVMAVVFVLSLAFEGQMAWLSPVRAFAEAALVGALADWFAVTALFRYPLGVPIPHTAIIPQNKARLGRSIGSFVQSNFLSKEVLESETLNISGNIAGWLGVAENRAVVTSRMRALVPNILDAVQEDEIKDLLNQQVEELIQRVDICRLSAKLLRLFTTNEMHEVLFEEFIRQGRGFFVANQDWFRSQVRSATPWFIPEFVDRRIFEAIAQRTDRTLSEALADRNHELRRRIHAAVESVIDKLQHGDEFRRKGEQLREMLLSSELFREYIDSLRDALLTDLRADLTREDSQVAAAVQRIMEHFVAAMSSSPELPEKINRILAQVVMGVLGERSNRVADLISRTIESWDTTTLVTKFEEQVGRDLQYIRINGTLVGGLVGLVLYGLGQLVR